jgi:hypothetical protein
LKKIQNQGTSSSGYFKNLKEPTVFMKEPVKNHWFSVQLKTVVIHQTQFFEYSENWQVSGCIPGLITNRYLSSFEDHPTLAKTSQNKKFEL